MNTKKLNIISFIQRLSPVNEIVRGASGAFIVKVMSTILLFISQILLARCMGRYNYGVYVFVFSWINILVMIAIHGWDTTLLRYVAAYNGMKKWPRLKGILTSASCFSIIGSILVSIGVICVVWCMSSKLSFDMRYTFLIGCGVLFFIATSGIIQAALRGLKHIIISQLPLALFRPFLMSLFVIITYCISGKISASAGMSMNLIACAVSFFFAIYLLLKFTPEEIRKVKNEYIIKEWLSVAFPLFLSSCLLVINLRVDIIMVGSILGHDSVGTYAAASNIAMLTIFGLASVNAIAAPIIAELYAKKQLDKLKKMVKVAARFSLVISLPVTIVLIIWGEFFLKLYGSKFTEGYIPLVILTIAQTVNVMAGSVGFLMTMTKYQKEASMILAVTVLINVMMNYLFIPRFGITGAAIATGTATVLWNMAMLIAVNKKLNLNPTAFSF